MTSSPDVFVFMCPLLMCLLKDSKVLSLAWDSLVGRSPEEVKQQKQQKLKGEIKEVINPPKVLGLGLTNNFWLYLLKGSFDMFFLK